MKRKVRCGLGGLACESGPTPLSSVGRTQTKQPPATPDVKAPAASGSSKKKPKAEGMKGLNRMQRFENAMKAYKWWEQEELPEGVSWMSLEHNALAFPPAYEPYGVKMLYEGEEVSRCFRVCI